MALLQWIIDGLGDAAAVVLAILPNSPFQTIALSHTAVNVMGYINYFVPVGQILTFFGLFLTATGIWYGARWVLRFAKFVE